MTKKEHQDRGWESTLYSSTLNQNFSELLPLAYFFWESQVLFAGLVTTKVSIYSNKDCYTTLINLDSSNINFDNLSSILVLNFKN